MQGVGVQFRGRVHRVEDDDLAILRVDAQALRAVEEVSRWRASASAREVCGASFRHVGEVKEDGGEAVLGALHGFPAHVRVAGILSWVEVVVVRAVVLHVVIPQHLDVLCVRHGHTHEPHDALIDLLKLGVSRGGQEVLRGGAELLGLTPLVHVLECHARLLQVRQSLLDDVARLFGAQEVLNGEHHGLE
eukprot:CAMPEP_0185209002 /NCGR_PEP_ID=MMETSP1140-20130426/63003_1 /TAXON_ID=298111 /ORGANISM="Pavlova sp., Strain CCMP459" /LENGTH=189 /DNA_ID=CAMNT_0027776753 /DNA_START=213 /DNA_END=782 /DNA_ORIENTATION=-